MGELASKIKKLKTMSFEEAVKKISIKLYEVPYYKFRKERIKLKPITIKSDPFVSFAPNYNFFFNSNDKESLINKIKSIDAYDPIIQDANKICSHVFNLLGSGDVFLGTEISWNKDFKSGFVWENRFYKDIQIVDLSNNADVKVPWELSRFQHLFTLGKAYWLTNDEKYVNEFTSEIEDWIKENPVEMSVNWTCTMDVGIRAVNWIAAYVFFKDSEVVNKDFWREFHKSLFLHGQFIMKNLENKGSHTGNHYLSNIVGLAWLGLFFNKFHFSDKNIKKQTKKWLEFSIDELEKEMFVQNNNDGSNYEASTSYHRLVTELFLVTTILFKKNDIHFTKAYMDRLEKMCEFIMNITKPNGLAPVIGDADDGRLLILSNYCYSIKNDFRHLLGMAGELFVRNDFKYLGKEYREDTLWTWKKIHTNLPKPKSLESISYPDGGYYIVRNKRIYCCIRCGELSFHGEGTHSHNDQLSFELNVDGEDFIIDPGSYVYTADYKMRNQFRGTNMHNTVQIEQFEQNDFEEKNLFYMKEETFAKCLEYKNDFFYGKHYGYLNKNGVIHERKVSLSETSIICTDILKAEGENLNEFKHSMSMILAPNVKIEEKDNQLFLTKNSIRLRLSNENILLDSIKDINISQSYGSITKGKLVLFENTSYQNNSVQYKIEI